MRIVLQRVKSAKVLVDGVTRGEIGMGAVLLLGVTHGDTEADVKALVDRCVGLRVFEDDKGKMNLSCQQVGGEFLIVPQFTLYGDTHRGRRPSFTDAAEPVRAESLYLDFVRRTAETGVKVSTGCFGEKMLVEIRNDGPVTFVMDSKQS
jgi:D-tyrosyl-tRNA(Tyr) deacylase